MQETATYNATPRLTVRISRSALSFSTIVNRDGKNQIDYEPYTLKNGISMAANLREAIRTVTMLREAQRVQVLIDTPVLMVPADLFREQEQQALYGHAFPGRAQETILHNVLPDLSCVAVFSVNRDLKTVISDRFSDVRYVCSSAPVWRHLHQRSYTGVRGKLYGYFHDGRLEIFNYAQNRFKFYNAFDTSNARDALYFLLYVWQQLMLKAEQDELHIVGDIPEREWLLEELRRYVKRAYIINPAGDFNRAAVTQISGIPYDLMTLYVKGR
ncbi:MAG: DUF3822 family protein [Prevotella sp.]|nr:DUF3822 family protein [Prevotella sp.]